MRTSSAQRRAGAPSSAQRAGAGAFQPGHQAQQRALAAAAAADDGDELARRDVQVDAAQHLARAVALGEAVELSASAAGRGAGAAA